jgi:Uma2 family endonuclease
MAGFPETAQQPMLDLSSAGLRMTIEQLQAIEDYCEIYDYELVDGVLVVRPGLDDANCAMSEELNYLLRSYRDEHPMGETLDTTVYGHYVNTTRAYRRTHRAIWTGLKRRPRFGIDVPSIVIEFVTPGRRRFLHEYESQCDEYLAAGVKELWLINRFERALTATSGPINNRTIQVFEEADRLRSSLLPGFELPLIRLFSAGDGFEGGE